MTFVVFDSTVVDAKRQGGRRQASSPLSPSAKSVNAKRQEAFLLLLKNDKMCNVLIGSVL